MCDYAKSSAMPTNYQTWKTAIAGQPSANASKTRWLFGKLYAVPSKFIKICFALQNSAEKSLPVCPNTLAAGAITRPTIQMQHHDTHWMI